MLAYKFFHGFGLALEATQYQRLVALNEAENEEDIEYSLEFRECWVFTVACFKIYVGI